MANYAISARGLGKRYRLGQRESIFGHVRRKLLRREPQEQMWALHDVTFDIVEGETVAFVGRNGAGKSTLLKILSRITEPTAGYADVRGRVGALLEVGTGFHTELSGRENVFLNGSILGMSRSEVRRKFDEIVDFSGVARHIDTPVKWYSSGMFVRLAFAVAAHLEPEVLIVDEVLAVGDAEFQNRCLGRMSEVANEGRTVLFVSHNLQAVRALCQKGFLLEHGELVAAGDSDSIVRQYMTSVEILGRERQEREGKEVDGASSRRRWDADDRPGDDTCRLVEVRVTDEEGNDASTLFSSQPIGIVFELDVLHPDHGIVVAVDVVSGEGAVVFRSYSTDVGGAVQPGVEPGRTAVRCLIPPNLLNGGRYLVNVRVHVRGIDGIVNEFAVLDFTVTPDHGDSYFLTPIHGRPGVIAPMLTWEGVEPNDDDTASPSPRTASTRR